MANNGGGVGFSTGFLLGGIIGVVVGVLIAPKPGGEMRSELRERSEGWRERADALAARARQRIQSAIEEGRETAARIGGKGDGTKSEEVLEEETP